MSERERPPFGDPWFALVPRVHRWLVGDEKQPFALGPAGHDYWCAAHYVARMLLGWQDCGRGFQQLTRMHDLKGPADLLVRGWPDRLDALGLWAWVHGEVGLANLPKRSARTYAPDDEERWTRAEALMLAFGFGAADAPDYDMHHLGHLSTFEHALTEGDSSAGERDGTSVVREGRRVVLFVDRLEWWPQALHRIGRTLQSGGPPSWRIDIVARHDGYLGQWRRCWDCGRWFQGGAEAHKLGHLAPR